MQPDRRLVTLVREGYEAAFEEIVHRYGRPLTRYAASIVGSRSEDVTQDAFSKALLALRRDDAEIELRPWLFRIVRNTALNDLRDSPPSPEVLAEAIAGGRDPAEELERREELADLMKRLQALPEPQRAAIVMRELEGLGHEEIAAALGLTGGGARQAIYRARRALRDGAGMLLPLPLLRLLIDHGTEAAGAGAGAGGAIAAAGASAGGAGAGGALKVGVVAAILAGSVGTGVALQDRRGSEIARDAAIPATRSATPSPTSSPSPSAPVTALVDNSQSGRNGNSGSRRNPGRNEESNGGHHGLSRGEHAAVDSFDGRGGDDPGPSHSGPPHRGGPHDEGGGDAFAGEGDRGGGREGSDGEGDRGAAELRSPDSSGHGGGPGPGGEPGLSPPPPPPEEQGLSGSGGSGGSGGGSGRSGSDGENRGGDELP
jgi:RNA polymerase sigma factor (sigma-70 family)